MSKSFQYVVIFSDDTCPSSEIDEDLTEPIDIGPKTQRGIDTNINLLFAVKFITF